MIASVINQDFPMSIIVFLCIMAVVITVKALQSN